MPSRRTVLLSAALGVVAAPALAACGNGTPATSASPGEAIIALDELEDGVPTVVSTAAGLTVVLTREGQDVSAISGVCTHQGCIVRDNGANLLCPCHGSEFAFDGSVAKGPATQPLPVFPVSVENGQVVTA